MAFCFRNEGWVRSAHGPAIRGASVYVCTQPASTENVPPTPLASIFSDPKGLVPITQPLLTSGLGHYFFYAAAGFYTVVTSLGPGNKTIYPDQTVGENSDPAAIPLALEVNGAPNVIQSIINLENSPTVFFQDNGDGSVSAINVSSVEVEVNSAPKANQSLLNMTDSPTVAFANPGGGIVSATKIPPADSISPMAHGLTINATGLPLSFLGTVMAVVSPNIISATATEARRLSIPLVSNFGSNYLYETTQILFGVPTYQITLGSLKSLRARVGRGTVDAGESILMWCGLTDADTTPNTPPTDQGLWISDTSLFNFIGFRYSVQALDVGWACVASNASGPQTEVLTNISPNAMHVLKLVKSGTSFQFYIDGVLITTMAAANIPAPGTLLTPFVGCSSNSGSGTPNIVLSNFWWNDINT